MPRTKEQFKTIKDQSKAKIIKAGLKLFINRGLLSTNVDEIASSAGISKGLIYHYFKSKEDLYCELIEIAIDSSNKYMQEVINLDISPTDKIKLISKTMTEELYENDEFAKYFVFINRSMIAENIPQKALEHFNNAFVAIDVTENIISKGQQTGEFKEGNARAMAILYWSAIHGLCANKLIMGDKFICPNPTLLDEIITKRKT